MKLSPATKDSKEAFLKALGEWLVLPAEELIQLALKHPRHYLAGPLSYTRPIFVHNKCQSLDEQNTIGRALFKMFVNRTTIHVLDANDSDDQYEPDVVVMEVGDPKSAEEARQLFNKGILVVALVNKRAGYHTLESERFDPVVIDHFKGQTHDLLYTFDLVEKDPATGNYIMKDEFVIRRFLNDAFFTISDKLKCYTAPAE